MNTENLSREELIAELAAAQDNIKALTRAEGNAVRGERSKYQVMLSDAIARANEANEAIQGANTERDAALAEVTAAAEELAKPQPDPTRIAAALVRARMPAAERERAELLAQKAELEGRLEKLSISPKTPPQKTRV